MFLHHSRGILYPERAVNDKDRPKILFSSDIPYKIATCVAELHLFQGGASKRLVDLSDYIRHFDITLELNALLLRNKQLTPSELVKRNQIFVAKSKLSIYDSSFDRSISGFSGVWKSILATRKKDEIFVVTFRLHLKKLSVDLAHVNDMEIEFDMHQETTPLLAADYDLVDHLKSYIRQKLLHELKSNSDISIHISDSSTILQDSPVNEYDAKFRDLLGPTQLEESDISNASLDESDTSLVIEKQLVFASEEEFDDSGEELKILHSNDSSKCTANEDDESDTLTNHDFEDLLPEEYSDQNSFNKTSAHDILNYIDEESPKTPFSEKNDYEHSDAHERSPASFMHPIPVPRRPSFERKRLAFESRKYSLDTEDPSKNQNDSFINEIENMRHNCEGMSLKATPENIEHHLSRIEESHESRDMLHSLDEITDVLEDSYSMSSSPKKVSVPASPTKSNKEGPLRKKASMGFIDHDDAHGLKYAFRDSSVPEYIKENKKFKFIKIGKVQKFVNMFEEQMDTPPEPHNSRHSSRPASPMKTV